MIKALFPLILSNLEHLGGGNKDYIALINAVVFKITRHVSCISANRPRDGGTRLEKSVMPH